MAAEIAPTHLITAVESKFDQSAERGLTLRDIADGLLLGEQSVRAAWLTLLRKLNAPDRTSAVVTAVRGGLVDLSVQLPFHLPPATAFSSPADSFA